MTHSLYFGPLQLIGGATTPYLMQVEGMDSGTNWGSPAPVEETLSSFLTDGEIVYYKNSQNRTVNLVVRVTGTRPNRALAEAALMAQLYKQNSLKWTPPEVGAATIVFDVLTSHLTPTPDDLREARSTQQVFVVELTCRPWVHSATKTVVAALAASGTTTTSVNAFTVTTGITGTSNGVSITPSTSGSAVTVASTTAVSGQHTLTATIAGSITTSTTKLLKYDWKAGAGNESPVLSAVGDGVALPLVASAPSSTAGYTTSWFYVAAASIATSVTFTLITGLADQPPAPGYTDVIRSLTMDQFSRTDVRPTLGSVKQQIRTLTISGAAPTVGTIAVQHATASLGDVLLFTCPDDGGGGVPSCRPVRVSGNGPTSDSTAISGFYDVITTSPSVFEPPVVTTPEGEYLIVGRLGQFTPAPGVTTVSWSVTPRLNSTDLAAAVTGSVVVDTASGNGYQFVPLGMVHLPSMDQAPSVSSVSRLTVAASTTTGQPIRLDEVLLCNLTIGRLSQFSVGSGTAAAGGPSNRLWLDSPAPENDGLGRLLRGFAADRSDAFSAWPSCTSPTVHELAPGINKVFTVATNPTTAVDVSYEFYPAGHSSVPA